MQGNSYHNWRPIMWLSPPGQPTDLKLISSRPSGFADSQDRIRTGLFKCMSHSSAHLKDEGTRAQVVIAGGIAGLVSRFVVAPLDVVKIRLQLQTHSLSDPLSQSPDKLCGSPIYKGTLPTLKRIIREEGLTGLWKGNIPAELMYVSYSAIQFTTYRSVTLGLQSAFGQRKLPLAAESLIAGSSAGAVATIATYPLDLLRTRFAAQGTEKIYSSLFASIRQIAQEEGSRGFYRGLSAAIGQIMPYMGILFATYETLRQPVANLNLPFGTGDGITGGIASVTAKTVVFPFDLIRKRLQVQGPTREKYVHKNIPVYSGVFKSMREIVKNEGKKGLYRGLTVSLLKAAPSSAVTMWTYERVMKFLIETWPEEEEAKDV